MVGSFLSHCDVFVKTPDVPSFQNSPDLFFFVVGIFFFVCFKIVLDFWCVFGLCSTDLKGSAWPPLAKKHLHWAKSGRCKIYGEVPVKY